MQCPAYRGSLMMPVRFSGGRLFFFLPPAAASTWVMVSWFQLGLIHRAGLYPAGFNGKINGPAFCVFNIPSKNSVGATVLSMFSKRIR
jgi:hypothetical protein